MSSVLCAWRSYITSTVRQGPGRAAMSSKQKRPVATPILSACVILARPLRGSDSYQLLVVERMARDGSQYLNATVFPGGQIEQSDNGNLRRAALRELYEEANIHLQPDPSQPGRVIPHSVKDANSLPYSEYLKSTGGGTAEDCLVPLARWVTPKVMPKRFDSHFFIALCSSDDNSVTGKVDGQEIKSLAWNSPSEALGRFADGKIILYPPQWCIFTDLSIQAPTFPELVKFCQRLPNTPQPMLPQPLKLAKNSLTVALWGDEDYEPDADEPQSQKGGRHRVTILSEDGKPRKIIREIRTHKLLSKL